MEDGSEASSEQPDSGSADVGCQANISLATRRKKTQTVFKGRSIGTQTEPSICNVGTQTNSTGAAQGPPSQAPPACHFTDDPWKHLDEQFSKDPPFCPEEWDMDESDDETSAPRPPPKPEQIYEPKFLVFDSCLRELLDSEIKVDLLHVENILQSTEVSSSNRMETEGMERCLNYLRAQDMSVDTLVTDRHSEGKAALRRNHPDIRHHFDVWHVAKGVNKKIVAVARGTKHSVLLKWIKTIIRHLHWCARTSDGDGKLVLAKWVSLIRHMINVHEHPDPLHPACEHGKISDRLWLEEGTETFKKLEAILMAPHLLRDIPFLSPKEQTFGLESFHAVLIHFAPKSSKFLFEGMLSRTYIAALHFNHNADRDVLIDEDGNPRFHQKCSKADRRWTVVPAKEAVTYDYVQKLIDAVLGCLVRWPTYAIAERAAYRQSHDTLSSKCGVKPQLEDAIARHRSRF
ncbi:uncharacterized protein ISCGN_010668 [Ixodes scapularis]